MSVLWDLAERAGMTMFGTSASYIAACMKAGVEPGAGRDLSRLKAVGSTGSPLAPEGFDWIYEHLGADTWLFSTSGGTDLCTAFVGGVAAAAGLPRRAAGARAGRRGRGLGRGRQRRDRRGRRAGRHRADALDAGLLLGRRGRQPLPRQLLRDVPRASGATATGSRSPSAARRSSTAAPTRRSTAPASAWARARSTAPCSASTRSSTRSSSTSPRPGTEGWMPLFVVLREGAELDDDLRGEIARRVRERCSPRHVPDEVFADRRGAAHAERQGARGPGQADPDGDARPSRPRAATRSPTRRRSTTSPRWQRGWRAEPRRCGSGRAPQAAGGERREAPAGGDEEAGERRRSGSARRARPPSSPRASAKAAPDERGRAAAAGAGRRRRRRSRSRPPPSCGRWERRPAQGWLPPRSCCALGWERTSSGPGWSGWRRRRPPTAASA